MLPALAVVAALCMSLPAARIEVLEGRAEVASDVGVKQLFAPARAVEVGGRAYVELNVRARTRVDWPGAASLEVYGPATLEWGPSESGALRLHVFACNKLLFETRRAPLEIEFPGGWRSQVAHGAGTIAGRQGGTFDLYLAAGSPGFLSARTGERIVWPALTLLPGAQVMLVPGRRDPVPQAGSARRLLDLHGREGAWERARPAGAWRSRKWPW